MMNSIKIQLYSHVHTYTILEMEKITMKVRLTWINEIYLVKGSCHLPCQHYTETSSLNFTRAPSHCESHKITINASVISTGSPSSMPNEKWGEVNTFLGFILFHYTCEFLRSFYVFSWVLAYSYPVLPMHVHVYIRLLLCVYIILWVCDYIRLSICLYVCIDETVYVYIRLNVCAYTLDYVCVCI